MSQPSSKGAGQPSEREIRSQLARILASEDFDASGRNRNFLRYVVEETVAGRTAYIKGYTVAQNVFGRGVDFDPQLDPVVRIEASRLRRSLERYYLTAGKTDPVRIELPKGGYVPRFTVKIEHSADIEADATAAASPAADAAPRPSRGPSLVVLPLESLGGELDGELLARGITEELIVRLLAYRELRVICANTSFKLPVDADPLAIGRRYALGYVLKGAIRIARERMRISLQLLDVESGQYLWAENFDRELTSADVWAVQEEVAAEIATRLGAPYGAIAKAARDSLAHRAQHGLDDYLAVLKAYGYRRQSTPDTHAEVRDSLEAAVVRNPASFNAWALLAILYIDEFRFGLNPQPDPLPRALEAAEQSVRWGSDSALSHLALSLVHHYRGEHEKAYVGARYAVTLNPDDPEVLAQAASRFLLSGQWDEGMVLLNRAMARDPEPPAWNYILLTLDAMRRGEYGAALRYADAANESRLPHVCILLCAIHDALGQLDHAAAALAEACANGRQWPDLREQVRRSVHDDALLERIERGVEHVRFRREAAQPRHQGR